MKMFNQGFHQTLSLTLLIFFNFFSPLFRYSYFVLWPPFPFFLIFLFLLKLKYFTWEGCSCRAVIKWMFQLLLKYSIKDFTLDCHLFNQGLLLNLIFNIFNQSNSMYSIITWLHVKIDTINYCRYLIALYGNSCQVCLLQNLICSV